MTGKSINFLKEKCQEQTAILDIVDILKKAEDETFDSLIDGRVENRIREAYVVTCAHLLDVLKERFHFNEHLKAMRRYLLLGQGDFIKMLMELLYHDLERDGREILKHNLMTLMGDAIRATNARFDEPYILDRLDITLMEATEREKGWDVFSLFYHFRDGGPLSCIFSQKKVNLISECVSTISVNVLGYGELLENIQFHLASSAHRVHSVQSLEGSTGV